MISFVCCMIDTSVLVVILVVTIVYYLSTNTYSKWRVSNVPHIPPWPLFGNTFKMIMELEHQVTTFDSVYKRFAGEKYCGFYQMKTPFLMIRDPDLVHKIMVKDHSYFPDHGFHKDPEMNMMALSLFFAEGSKWRTMRQKLSPGFTSGKLKLTIGQIKECSEDLMRYIGEKIDNRNGTMEVKEIMSKYAIDVIGTCAFGLKLNTVKNDDSEFREHAKCLLQPSFRTFVSQLVVLTSPTIAKFLGISEFAVDDVEFFEKTFGEVIKYRETNNIVRHDVAQSLIQARHDLVLNSDTADENKFTDLDIIANAIAMFVAGSESVSSGLSFCLYQLALHQDIQNKVREEIRSVMKKHGEFNNDFLVDLQYTGMVLAETQRMYLGCNALFREASETYHVPNDSLVIEKGTKIMIPICSLHNDPKYFPNPSIFDPQRFSPEENAKRPFGVYLPFSDGPRHCIGKRFAQLEMKLALSEILTTFKVVSCEKTENPLQMQNGSPMMMAKNGIWLSFQPVDPDILK